MVEVLVYMIMIACSASMAGSNVIIICIHNFNNFDSRVSAKAKSKCQVLKTGHSQGKYINKPRRLNMLQNGRI